MAAIPIGFILGGPIAGSILKVHWFGITGWRWLFLLEGLPAVLFGTIALFIMPDWPKEAKWLPPDERDWITGRLDEERRAKADMEQMTIWRALRHPAVLVLTAGLFSHIQAAMRFGFGFQRCCND
jgi:ACS family tartrate transporter-like MFS transporter